MCFNGTKCPSYKVGHGAVVHTCKHGDNLVVLADQDVLNSFKAAVVWSRLNIQQITQQWIDAHRLKWFSFVRLLECRSVSNKYWVHIRQ